ncbi:MAG: hypothetical protein PUB72_04390, partial [Ruminococcus sp.]|nr:hypothetical protein [Ruminococcus sp.]
MISFEEFANIPNGTIQLDWNLVESVLGFQVHNGLKNFYSRIICNNQNCIKGTYNLKVSQFIKPPNDKYVSWIELISGAIDYELYPLCSTEKYASFIQAAFTKWTGGFDMGRRAMIGSFYTDVG